MAGAESAVLLSALRRWYAEVNPLETFIRRLEESRAGEAGVLRSDDDPSCRTFVERCLVCVPHGAPAIPQGLNFQQVSSYNEFIGRVLQRVCGKGKKNVLAYGYSLLDQNSSGFYVLPSSNVYSYLPNSGTDALLINGVWELMLSRMGDAVMMYLLEHCAIFMLVPPNNCYQICGQPVYELVSQNTDSFPVFVKQRFSKHKCNRLLDYVQKRLSFHRKYLSKSRRWQCRQRLEDNVSSMRNKKNSKIQSLVSSYQYSAKAVSKASKQIRMVTERLEKTNSYSLCSSFTAPSLKRKLHTEQLEIPAKRAKVEEKVREEKACNLTPDVNQSSSKRDETGYVASHPESLIENNHISQRSNSAMSGPSLVHISPDRKKFVAGESSLLQEVQNNKPLKSSTEMQAESCRKGVETHMSESQLNSVQIKPVESNSSKCRRQESPLHNLAKKLPNRLLSSAVYIDRKSLLYSRRSFRECFPKSFSLNSLQGCKAGGRRLIETIFLSQNPLEQRRNQSLPHHSWRKKRLPKRYWQMRHTFQKLLKNHGECPYLALLKKNCPVRIPENVRKIKLPHQAEVHEQAEQSGKEPTKCVTSSRCESGHTVVSDNLRAPLAKSVCGKLQSEEQNPGEESDSALRKLIKQYSSHWQVYLFVRECLQHVIPAELWGSNHNKCRFLKNVQAFISRGKFVKFSLQELMWKMRVNDCVWLRLGKGDRFVPADEHCFREELLAKFLYWLMDTYVVQLLRSFFYITETMFQKNMLFYYRKFVWGKLQNIGIRNHFARVRLRPLSAEETEDVRQKKVILTASKLRFIPKPNGLRPIVKVTGFAEAKALSRKNREKKMNQYNAQLKNLFSVLNYEWTINTSIIGSSVFGKDDIYKTWKQFVVKVLESGDKIPHFYCVKADVSRAYDTIPHKKLVEVISQILKPEKTETTLNQNRSIYFIRRYAVIMITPGGRARKFYRRHVSTYNDFKSDVERFVSQLKKSTSLQNAIVVEQNLTLTDTDSLLDFFLHVIYNNVLEIGNRYYVQCCGIPQGSILSTLLCNLFYGDMENKLLSGVQQDGVLIRLIDDFLLVTPHLLQARTFLRTLATGIPEYGFLINPNKTFVNFSVDDIPGCAKFKRLPNCLMPWCGLLLNIETLEVYSDYSSYAATSIRSSLSFNSSRTAGKNMKNKLISVLKLKCHCLFLDLEINSLRTVLINIYKIFLLQAYRFHACVLQLPFNQKVRKNPNFFLRIISETASCCYAILKAKNAGFTLGNRGASGVFPFEAAEWLCYHAFIVKLSNHKVVYKCLLKPLKVCQMQLLRKISEDTMALLKAVTEPSICQDFNAILD